MPKRRKCSHVNDHVSLLNGRPIRGTKLRSSKKASRVLLSLLVSFAFLGKFLKTHGARLRTFSDFMLKKRKAVKLRNCKDED